MCVAGRNESSGGERQRRMIARRASDRIGRREVVGRGNGSAKWKGRCLRGGCEVEEEADEATWRWGAFGMRRGVGDLLGDRQMWRFQWSAERGRGGEEDERGRGK